MQISGIVSSEQDQFVSRSQHFCLKMEKQAQASFEKLTLNDKGDSASRVISLKQIRTLMCASAASGKDSSATYEILKSCIDRVQCTDLDNNMFIKMYPSEPEFALKVLKLFATEKADTIFTFSSEFQVEPSEGGPVCAELAKMRNLERIRLYSYHVSLKTLMDMCGKLPKLKEIFFMSFISRSLLLTDDPVFIENFQKSLNHLEKIDFYPMYDDADNEAVIPFQEKLTNFCVINLPNIHVVRTYDQTSMSKACREFKGKSRLKKMVIKAVEIEDFIQNLAKFPSVEGISIIDEDWNNFHPNDQDIRKNLCQLESLPNFNYLAVKDLVSTDHLELYLSSCGRNIKSLFSICNLESDISIDFDLIQKHCPKLGQLHIFEVCSVDDSKSLDKFISLNCLVIYFESSSPRKIQLTNLLAAPQLENVKIIGFQITRQELTKAIEAVERKTILKKVSKVELKIDKPESHQMTSAIDKGMKRFISALKSMRQNDNSLIVKVGFMKICD